MAAEEVEAVLMATEEQQLQWQLACSERQVIQSEMMTYTTGCAKPSPLSRHPVEQNIFSKKLYNIYTNFLKVKVLPE